MLQLTEIYTLRTTKIQKQSLRKLKAYNVDVGRFIRDAIREKISRDWPKIKEENNNEKTPF